MLSETTVRQAFLQVSHAFTKVKAGSDKSNFFMGAAAALGWVLDEGVYAHELNNVLREIRSHFGEVVEKK